MRDMRAELFDEIVRNYHRTPGGRAHLEDIQGIRSHAWDNRVMKSSGTIVGRAPRGVFKWRGSIPIDLYNAAAMLFPEVPRKRLAVYILERAERARGVDIFKVS